MLEATVMNALLTGSGNCEQWCLQQRPHIATIATCFQRKAAFQAEAKQANQSAPAPCAHGGIPMSALEWCFQ